MLKKGFEEADVLRGLTWAKDNGYVSDDRVTARETEIATNVTKIGSEKLHARLSRRGLEANVVVPPEQELANAIEIALKRRDFGPQKVARVLTARGYGEETVRAALDEIFPGWEE